MAYVAPNGGCDMIPDEVDEIQFIFMHPETPNRQNPFADANATLKMGMVFFTGPISDIAQAIELLMERAERGQLSSSFLTVIGAAME